MQEKLDYPVTVVADPYPDGSRAADEKELRKTLGLVFRSEPLKKVVPQLLDLVS
jgi:hypothetical protein